MSVSSRDPGRAGSSSVASIVTSASAHTRQSSSSRAHSERSHMESAVTKLLVATRQLLDSLTAWSKEKITETEVSDVYVRLGNDFNSAVAAFQDVGIPMTELLSVPNQLRGCLERCLAEDPTPRNLERYLPEIRNTIVALLQGLKSKQAIYKTMREEKRRATAAEAALPASPARQQSREEEARARMRYERQDSSRSEQERDRDAERARALEREREREWNRERAAASAASSSAGSSSYYGGSREELAPGGSIGTAGGRATPDLNGEDGRWIPPQNQGRYMNQFAVASESNNHQTRYDANGLPLLPNMPTRYSSATATHSLGPAVHITQGSVSSPALVSGAATATDAERPFSTTSTLSSEGSTTSGGNGSSQYPAAPGAPPTRRFQGSGRHVHGSPLPPAPADAFRPARRVPSGPSVRRHGSRDERGSDSQLNSEPSTAERAPSPIREEQPVQGQPATLRRQRSSFSGTDGAGLVKRHSLVDTSIPQFSGDRDSHHDAAAVPPTLPTAAVESSANLTLQQGSDTNFSSTTNSVCQPEDASVSPLPTVIIAPSPPLAPAPLFPSQALPPPPPPPPPSVADQTLSALRRGDKSISRRASQRYSTYQIGKIMDSDGVSGSGGSSMKRRPSEIGLADMLAGGSDSGGSSAGPSPGRPQRASRAMPIPPVPALPAGLVGSSPLRGGASGRGFVPSVEEIPESPGGQTTRADESVPLGGSSLLPGGSPSQGGLLTPPNPRPVPLPSTQISPSGVSVAATRPETITLFLLHGRECKKVHVPPDPSVPAIRLLFMEKFGFTAEGAEFPAIYVRDPRTEWRYEWEDGEDLEDGVQLSLNVEPLDQVKTHIDGQISSLTRTLETLIRDSISPLSTQFAALQAVQQQVQVRPTPRPLSIVQQQTRTSPAASPLEEADAVTAASATSSPAAQPATSGDAAAAAAPSPSTVTVATAASSPTAGASVVSATLVNAIRTQFDEAQQLRRELGVLRQVHADGMAAVKETFARVRAENRRLQDLAKTTAALGGGRAFVEAGKTKIDEQSQDVLRRIEDLGDILDDLRADVTSKEVVPKPSIMRSLKKDIVLAKEELEALRKSTDAAATTWRTTWEAEMQNVMAEESMLRHHLALVVDIQEDYTGLKEVFDQIELYVATKGPPTPSVVGRGRGYRSPSPMDADPAASLSSVFSEIQGAQIDPSKRLRAIESAQRMREREKAAKAQGGGNVLAAQLSEFVDGRKLRKTGGVEETERLRQRRNELALRGGHPPRQQPSTSSSSSSPTMARAPSVGEGGESGGGGGEPSSVSPSVSAAAEEGPANGSNSGGNTPTTPATPNTEAPPQPPPLTSESAVDVGKKEEADEGAPTAATDAEARSGGGESEEGEGEAVAAKEDEGLA